MKTISPSYPLVIALLLYLTGCVYSPTNAAPAKTQMQQSVISAQNKYPYRKVNILGSQLAYIDIGEGDPILFLHGVPTSSYLWRNIMPHLEGQARLIAPDLIGFGQSDKPDVDYSFQTHYHYLEAFISHLKLDQITLVVHDWGSGLGLHFARQHPSKIKALVTMESILAPIMPANQYSYLTKGSEKFFRMVRDPMKSKELIIEQNFFIERVLPNSIIRPLDKSTHDSYRKPFKTRRSRIPIYHWPQHMPIEGKPAHMHKIVADYNHWLMKMDKPWLFFYSTPGALNPPRSATYWNDLARDIQIVDLGPGKHFLQEDHPHVIGQTISNWYKNISNH